MVKVKHKRWFDLVYLVRKNTFKIGVIQLSVITSVFGFTNLLRKPI